jgi:hypothetical protein
MNKTYERVCLPCRLVGAIFFPACIATLPEYAGVSKHRNTRKNTEIVRKIPKYTHKVYVPLIFISYV